MRARFLVTCLVFTILAFAADRPIWAADNPVEQWGILEIELKGPTDGNPFSDVELEAQLELSVAPDRSPTVAPISVKGFYDGDGVYRIRFMPKTTGQWHYKTRSNRTQLDGKEGTFTVVAPTKKNHGPVRVRNTYHFGYADGTPYFPFGTTCYAWIHQSDELQKQTLETLAGSPFNKVRMCVFPKWYAHNHREPALYPYEGGPPNHWDFTRF